MCSVRSVKPAHAIDDFQPVCLIRFFRQLHFGLLERLAVARVSYTVPSSLYQNALFKSKSPPPHGNLHLQPLHEVTCWQHIGRHRSSLARRRIFVRSTYDMHRCALHTAQRESTARSRLTESTEGSCSHSVTSAARAPPLDSTTRWPRVRLEIDLVSGSPSCNRRTRHGVRELAGNHSGISYRASWASGHGRG